MTKRARLNDIVKCCEVRFNRGDATTWKHGDFVDLNREIQRDTNVNISPNTLKRIFGKIAVDEDYIPQQATLDALKKYGRYADTEISPPNTQAVARPQPEPQPVTHPKQEPQLVEQPQQESQLVTDPKPELQPTLPNRRSNFKKMAIVLIALIVSTVTVGFLTWRLLSARTVSGKIRMTRTEGRLPATAYFDLQIPETSDSLFVNFGDKSPLSYILPGRKNAAHIYYIPGVFTVSVQTRQQAIASTTVYIRSDNWIGLVFHNQQEIPDHFYKFPAVKTGSNSLFQVTNSQLSTMGLDTTGVVLTRLCNYTPVAYNSDNFIFEATFRNATSERVNYCRGTQFQISGSNSMITRYIIGKRGPFTKYYFAAQ